MAVVFAVGPGPESEAIMVTAPAGATADSTATEPAVPAAISVAARSRLARVAGFKA